MILGFNQVKTDAEVCTAWTREGTIGWGYVLIHADVDAYNGYVLV